MNAAAIPEPQKFPVLNRLLKPYQINEVAAMTAYQDAGVSSMLSAEMGLGKTFTGIEKIARSQMKKLEAGY